MIRNREFISVNREIQANKIGLQSPNRTTEIAHRDKPTNRLESPLNSRVSGSVSNDLNRQHPANSRAFPDPSSDPSGKSLHPEPGWRWGESGGNSSLRTNPCQAGKIQGISPISDSLERIRSEIPEHFRRASDGFPVIENREFIPASREIVRIRSGLRAEAMEPMHPLNRLGD